MAVERKNLKLTAAIDFWGSRSEQEAPCGTRHKANLKKR
jgi:hypothetical protein